MAEKVLMIALSPTMETGTLVKWRKKEGDTVKSGDVLCEVETDKATMDYESSTEGVLLKIILPEGGQARVGDPIAVIGKPGEDVSGLAAEAAPAVPAGAGARAAPAAPASAPPASGPSRVAPSAPAPAAPGAAGGRLRSSPLARRLAEEKGVDLATVAGSGPGGRIVKRDVETQEGGSLPGRQAAGFSAFTAPPARPAPGDQLVGFSAMRKTIARRLSESAFTAPHIYLTVSALVDGLLSARARLNEGRSKKLSLNAFLIKLTAEMLKRHPRINSSWTADGILLLGRIDIGLAVALPDGLITPVVRDCGSKGIAAIDAELADLVERSRAGKLRPEEYSGAGFTVSNLGSFGIEEFTAIINPPGSAILAVGAVRKETVVGAGDAITVASRMRMTLSCDHRVIDGAVGAAFLADLATAIENPILTLL